MFTQDEAGSMLLAGKLVEKMADKSVRTAFESAMLKIRSVLNESEKDHLQNLDSHISVFLRSRYEQRDPKEFPDHFMTEIQGALGRKQVLRITYVNNKKELTEREVEPVGIFYYSMGWHLIGWCRLRNDYRDFRADHIKSLVNTGEPFRVRSQASLQDYFSSMFQNNRELHRVVVRFEKSKLRERPIYGSVSQVDLGEKLQVEFPMDNLHYMAHWLLMFGTAAEVEQPEELKMMMAELVEELHSHYASSHSPISE
ncbi:WYL domain-containing protein [Oscillatoria amoena NRMC-F 0135]|nr:WYL domain-containing protein [Oscillatoria amoena NRMC-F 0135]